MWLGLKDVLATDLVLQSLFAFDLFFVVFLIILWAFFAVMMLVL